MLLLCYEGYWFLQIGGKKDSYKNSIGNSLENILVDHFYGVQDCSCIWNIRFYSFVQDPH